jgi:hypothetical protein
MAIPTSRIPGLVPKEWREPAPKSPLSLLLFGKTGDEKAERRATRPGKMLALFYLGKGFALTSQSGSSFMDDFVEQSEGYALDDAPIDYELPTGDGLWIGRMRLVGVGARECIVRVDEWRAPTLEEWSAHLRGEWPWAEELEDATVEPKP